MRTFDIPEDDPIRQSEQPGRDLSIGMSDYGFPPFRCAVPVTTEDVKFQDDDSVRAG